MNARNTTTTLFTIVAAITLFGVMGLTEAESNTNDIQERSAYEKLLLNAGEGVKDYSDTEKAEYVIELRKFILSLDGYGTKVFEKLTEYAKIKEKLEIAENEGEDTKQLNRDLARLQFELEDLGVTTKDRLDANPKYWMEKIEEVKESIEGASTKNVVGFDNESNLHYVHQTDLALKRDAVTSVPCLPLDLGPLYCSAVASGWNAGTSTATWWFMMFTGNVVFYSATCLDQPTHHSSVDFQMDTVRKVISVTGNVATSSNTYEPNFDSKGDCETNELTQWVEATNRVETETSISNISLN